MLTYGQWATEAITKKPMWNMEQYINSVAPNETDHSYARLYKSISLLSQNDFTPEVSYFAFMADEADIFPNLNFTDIIFNMDTDHLYNQEMWGDLLLNVNKTGQEQFNTAGFKKYLKYATIQSGLFGLFTERTPRELVEGYTDPLVNSLT